MIIYFGFTRRNILVLESFHHLPLTNHPNLKFILDDSKVSSNLNALMYEYII